MNSNSQVLCTVKHVPSNNYFVKIPRRYFTNVTVNISNIPIVQISLAYNTGKSYFCSVSGHSRNVQDDAADDMEVVEMSNSIGINDKEAVLIRKPQEAAIGLGVKVVVSPASSGDWQIIQLNQHKVEQSVLNQVRIVQPGQKLKIIIDKLSLFLIVKTVEPERQAVVLQNMTEFIIDVSDTFKNRELEKANMSESTMKQETEIGKEEQPRSLIPNIIQSFTSIFYKESVSNREMNIQNHFFKLKYSIRFRAQLNTESSHPYTCFVTRQDVPEDIERFLAKICVVPMTFDPKLKPMEDSLVVQVKVIERRQLFPGTVLLSETLMKWKGLNNGSRVHLESLSYLKKYSENVLSEIHILCDKKPSERDILVLKKTIDTEDINFVPLPCLIECNNKVVQIKSKEDKSFGYFQTLKYQVFVKEEKPDFPLKISNLTHCCVNIQEKLEPTFRKKEIEDCLKYLKKLPKSNRHFNILVCGNSGSGKSSFVKQVATKMNLSDQFWASKIINCVTLKGKRTDTIKKQLESVLDELDYLSPGILILDNLDTIVPVEEEENPFDPNKSLASWICSILLHDTRYKGVSIIATVKSSSCLHQELQSTRGNIPFRKQVSLLLPNKLEVEALLKFYTDSEFLELSSSFLSQAEGCSLSDLRKIADKVFTKYDQIMPENFDLEIKDFVPASRWGQNLKPKESKKLEEVGSLQEAKHSLLQTLLWPSKYPQLFAQCGVRTPKGVLIFGAPGTGKTLLAEAVTSHTGLNMISVRGPELLSKYIGASESNVRDLFIRAQSAKPCIIFFDEFESLAPRRGQDSTGVTDRVVNQLLTQLDGVEGLTGVWVVAASSRPDLIDPALLRPGRLDRHVLCPMPALRDRAEILEVLLRNTNVADDVDLDIVADMSDGMTGADLRGVVYSALLSARHRGGAEPRVNQNDLIEAVTSTQPSVTSVEVRKYDNIYKRFVSGKPNKSDLEQRVTLA